MRALVIAAFLMLLHAGSAFAVLPDEVLKDPALEERARDLSQQLRCMVCQNQSIDDSEAPLAHDLRVLVRDRLTKGDSDTQVLDFVVARYGEFVLLKPRFAWHNALLWAVSPCVLLLGAIALWISARRRRLSETQPDLDADEQRKLAAMLHKADQ